MKRRSLILLLCLSILIGCGYHKEVVINDIQSVETNEVDVIEESEELEEEGPISVVVGNLLSSRDYSIELEPTMPKNDFIDYIKSINKDNYIIDVNVNHILSKGAFPELYEEKVVTLTGYTEDGDKVTIELKKLNNDETLDTRLDYYNMYEERNGDLVDGDALTVTRLSKNAISWTTHEKAGIMCLAGNIEVIINCPEYMFDKVNKTYYKNAFSTFSEIVDFSGLDTMDFYIDTDNASTEEIISKAEELLNTSEQKFKSIFEYEVKKYTDILRCITEQNVTNAKNTFKDLYDLINIEATMTDTITIQAPLDDYDDLRSFYHLVIDMPSDTTIGNNKLIAYPLPLDKFEEFYDYYHDASNGFVIDEFDLSYDPTGNSYYVFSGNVVYELILDIHESDVDHNYLISMLEESRLVVNPVDMMRAYNY